MYCVESLGCMLSHPICFITCDSYCFHLFAHFFIQLTFAIWKNNTSFFHNLIPWSFHAFCTWWFICNFKSRVFSESFKKWVDKLSSLYILLSSPIIFGSLGNDHLIFCPAFNWSEQLLALKFNFLKHKRKWVRQTVRGINISCSLGQDPM